MQALGLANFTISVQLTSASQPDQPAISTARRRRPRLFPGIPVAVPVPRPPDVLGLAAGGLPKVFGDFRGNGALDYVGADGIHLGLGDGTFQSSAIPLVGLFTAPTNLTAIAAVRAVDRGGLDLVVAGYESSALTNKLQVLVGQGDGRFHALPPVDLRIRPVRHRHREFHRRRPYRSRPGRSRHGIRGGQFRRSSPAVVMAPSARPSRLTWGRASSPPPSLPTTSTGMNGPISLSPATFSLTPLQRFPLPPPCRPLPPCRQIHRRPIFPPPLQIVLPFDPPLPGTSLLPKPSQEPEPSGPVAGGYGLVTILVGNGDGTFGLAKQSFYTSWRVDDLFGDGLIPLSLSLASTPAVAGGTWPSWNAAPFHSLSPQSP